MPFAKTFDVVLYAYLQIVVRMGQVAVASAGLPSGGSRGRTRHVPQSGGGCRSDKSR